jgi:hypothetical protein
MIKTKILVLLLLILIAVCIAIVVERTTHPLYKFIDTVVHNNRHHYLTCDKLPNVSEVGRVVEEHKDVVEQIVKTVGERVHGSVVTPVWEVNEAGDAGSVRDGARSYSIEFSWGESFSWGPSDSPYPGCPNTGRGDIEISTTYVRDREVVEKIIGDTFFGIPYRMPNL